MLKNLSGLTRGSNLVQSTLKAHKRFVWANVDISVFDFNVECTGLGIKVPRALGTINTTGIKID